MKGRKVKELVEVVADIEEFREIVDPASRLHYKILSEPGAMLRGVAVEWIAGLDKEKLGEITPGYYEVIEKEGA